MKIHTINTGLFKLDGGAMFGVVPKTIWQKKYIPDENNLCYWAMRCLLIEDNDKLILIDTGAGNKQSEKFFSHYYMDNSHTLEKSILELNYKLEDVTDVILTHFHFDHIGGAVKIDNEKPVPTFKNANYWTNKTHLEEANKPNEREKSSFFTENFLPLIEYNKLKFIEEKQDINFTNNIKVRFAYGHTNALMYLIINYNKNEIVYIADLIPSIGHIPIPYVAGYDSNPLISMKEKKEFLLEAYQKKWILFFEHEPYNECCSLKMTDKGIREDKIFSLNDLK